MSKTAKATIAYHQPATMAVDCGICGAHAGQHCRTRRRQAERETHRARVTLYTKIQKQKEHTT